MPDPRIAAKFARDIAGWYGDVGRTAEKQVREEAGRWGREAGRFGYPAQGSESGFLSGPLRAGLGHVETSKLAHPGTPSYPYVGHWSKPLKSGFSTFSEHVNEGQMPGFDMHAHPPLDPSKVAQYPTQTATKKAIDRGVAGPLSPSLDDASVWLQHYDADRGVFVPRPEIRQTAYIHGTQPHSLLAQGTPEFDPNLSPADLFQTISTLNSDRSLASTYRRLSTSPTAAGVTHDYKGTLPELWAAIHTNRLARAGVPMTFEDRAPFGKGLLMDALSDFYKSSDRHGEGFEQGGPVEMETGGGVLRKLIRAYHGSPYAFSKFDPTKVGSGEGAQAYGYGHYFTDTEDIARGYRDRLSKGNLLVDDAPVSYTPFNDQKNWPPSVTDRFYQKLYDEARQNFHDNNSAIHPDDLVDALTGAYAHGRSYANNNPTHHDTLGNLVESLRGKRVEYKPGGHMYDVNLGVNPQDLLNWDAPIGTQAAYGRVLDSFGGGDALMKRNREFESLSDRLNSSYDERRKVKTSWNPEHTTAADNSHDALQFEWDAMNRDPLTRMSDLPAFVQKRPDIVKGAEFYNRLSSRADNGKAASGLLQSLDVPGIKYLDGFSRGAGKGTSNYVMFPGTEDLIDINRRYEQGGPVDTPTEGDGGLYGAPDSMFNTPESLAAALYPQHDTAYGDGGEVEMALGGTPPNTAPAVPDMPQLPESEGAGFFRNNIANENYAGQLDWLKKAGAPTIQRPGKVQDVHNWATKVGGAEQGRRVEQAADLTNLGHFSSNALHETFAPGNSSLLMALPPGRFEDFSARLPAEYMARTPYGRYRTEWLRQNSVSGHGRIPDSEKTMDAYLSQLFHHMATKGADEVPTMWLAPPRPLFGEVAQHQGRHRARAMAQAGDENMLLHIKPANDGDMRGSLAERLERLTDKYFPSGAATRFEPEMDWKKRIPLSFPFAPFAEGGEVHMSTGGQYDAPEPEGAGFFRNQDNYENSYAGPLEMVKEGARTVLARQHMKDTPRGRAAPPDPRIQTVRDPERMVYPGIYKDPNVIAEEASRRLMRDQGKDGPMSLLFGHTRASLDELSQGRDLEGMRPWPLRQAYTPPGGSTGSAVSERVLTRRNANRLLDIHGEAMKYPGLRETRSWYEMLPLYQRMDELGVPIDEQRLFNQRTGIFSAAASPVSEINRGTLAHHLAQQGRIEDFVKYGGVAEKNRLSLLGFPDDLLDMKSHAYHRTAQAPTLAEIEMSGGYYPKEHKVGTYVAATDPVFPNYTRPVADSHIARGVGYSDVRPGKLANVKANLSNPEYTDFAPWWENSIAGNTGLRSRDQQALLWNVLGPQTGVRYIGPSKLELMSNQMMKASKRLGVSPEQARDMVLRGEAGAYKEGGTVEDQYHPIWQQSFAGGGQPEEEPHGFFKSPYTPKERAAIARERNNERLGEMNREIARDPGAHWRDLLTQTLRGGASLFEFPGLAGDALNYISPNAEQQVPHWGTSEGISELIDRMFPTPTSKYGAEPGRRLGEVLSNTIGLGVPATAGRVAKGFAHAGNALGVGSALMSGPEGEQAAEWQEPREPSYDYERFMRDQGHAYQDLESPRPTMAHGGSVEDQYHPIWSQNFAQGGHAPDFGDNFKGLPGISTLADLAGGIFGGEDVDLHSILGEGGRALGTLVGAYFGMPGVGGSLGEFGGDLASDLIEPDSGDVGRDAARIGTGFAKNQAMGAFMAGGGAVDDLTDPGMPSFGHGIPGFDVDMLPMNPGMARADAERRRMMAQVEQASQRGLAQQMKSKDSGGGGGMGDIMGMVKMAAQFAPMFLADGGSIPAPNGEQPWMYGGGALMARGGYLRGHGGMNG